MTSEPQHLVTDKQIFTTSLVKSNNHQFAPVQQVSA
jgi:hypothetical protein